MAEAHRTRDHSLWFNAGNFRENAGEGILAALTALTDGQAVSLLLNEVRTQWARYANGSQALRAADPITRQTWDAIPIGSWATVMIAPPVGSAAPPAPAIVAAPPAHSPAATATATPVPMRGAPGLGPRACLFDAYIFIDWSATNRRATGPGKDQLWLGELQAGNQPSDAWFACRSDCACHVEERLLHHVAAGRRVLVGFDFAYGYPAGFTDGAGLPSPAGKWRAVWTALSALLRDDAHNRSNRFEVASGLNAMLTPAGAPVAPGPFWNTPSPGPMLMIKDQAQVRAMCLWAEQLDEAGTLGQQFATPAGMSLDNLERCVNEEGWILGSP